jgi:hypothetical protein
VEVYRDSAWSGDVQRVDLPNSNETEDRMKRLLCVLGFVLLASVADAQTTVVCTPNCGVSFNASPDHNSTTSLLTDYTGDVRDSAGVVVTTISMGKPTPDVTNTILVQPMFTPAQWNALPVGTYTLVVKANGPAGSGVSTPSNPFVRPGTPAAPGQPVIRP